MTKADTALVEQMLWHVEQVCGPLSREVCVIEGDDDYTILRHNFVALLESQAATIAELQGALEKAGDALEPSDETKAAYMSEFSFYITETAFDEDAEEFVENQRKVYVPWTTVKEIMVAIRERALNKSRSAG